MSTVMLTNLIVFYSFLIIVLSISLCCFIKTRKNRIKITHNNSLVYKILECYSIDIPDFIDFIDCLVNDLHTYYKCVNKDILKADLLNYFILFLSGQNVSLSKLDQYCRKYKKRLPLLYIIRSNFVLNEFIDDEEIIYYLISNRFSLFLEYSSQKDLGFQFFEWIVPVDDENVCPFCKAAKGKIFSWKEGNNGKLPGQNKCSINGFCRCKTKSVNLTGKNVKIIKNKDSSYSINE